MNDILLQIIILVVICNIPHIYILNKIGAKFLDPGRHDESSIDLSTLNPNSRDRLRYSIENAYGTLPDAFKVGLKALYVSTSEHTLEDTVVAISGVIVRADSEVRLSITKIIDMIVLEHGPEILSLSIKYGREISKLHGIDSSDFSKDIKYSCESNNPELLVSICLILTTSHMIASSRDH